MKTKKAIFDEHAAAIYEIFDDEIIGAEDKVIVQLILGVGGVEDVQISKVSREEIEFDDDYDGY